MLKNLILMEDRKYECDTKEELVKLLLGNDYYEKTEKEKREIMELKATINCSVAEMNHEDYKEFVLKDETTYILSLLRLNKVILLERKDCNIFTKDIDKSQIKENYIIVNSWADKLLEQNN